MKHILKIKIEVRSERDVDGEPQDVRADAHFIERALSDYANLLCEAFEGSELWTFSPRHRTEYEGGEG